MPCVAHAPHYRRERRSRVRKRRFDGRFKEKHDSSFKKEIQIYALKMTKNNKGKSKKLSDSNRCVTKLIQY